MNKELINKLIGRAREASDNAYCPHTNAPTGCALLTEENMIFTGCNIESKTFSVNVGAGEVAVVKAISEGHLAYKAACFYCATHILFPDGRVRQLLIEFSPLMNIIVANDETYHVCKLSELLPFAFELPEAE